MKNCNIKLNLKDKEIIDCGVENYNKKYIKLNLKDKEIIKFKPYYMGIDVSIIYIDINIEEFSNKYQLLFALMPNIRAIIFNIFISENKIKQCSLPPVGSYYTDSPAYFIVNGQKCETSISSQLVANPMSIITIGNDESATIHLTVYNYLLTNEMFQSWDYLKGDFWCKYIKPPL